MNEKLRNITKTIENLKDRIRRDYKAEIVGIFGSYVRGEEREGSDLDVLVSFLEGATLLNLVGLANYLEETLGMKVDVVPVDTIREEIRESVLKEAVYL